MKPDPSVVGIAGLGAMGLGIAQVFAQAGYRVLATDADSSACERSAAVLEGALSARVLAGKLTKAESEAALGRFNVVSPDALGPAGLVIEAIAEKLAAKQLLFSMLEGIVAPDAVFATNTSSLSVGDIAGGLHHPGRVVGLHFFNPATSMRLVELVGHARSSAEAIERARAVAEAAGKTVVLCPDSPGFIVNRCARPFYGEALAMMEEGRSASEIDAAMLQAGYRIGPLSLIDLIGADINMAATESLSAAFGNHPRYHVFDTLRAQVARGDLGKKSGRGFLYPGPVGGAPQDAETIVARIEAVLVNEACSLLSRGGVSKDGIDTAVRLGLNFPKGPFEILQARGAKAIVAELDFLEARAPQHLRNRYSPSALLIEAA